MTDNRIAHALMAHGLIVRGRFRLGPDDGLGEGQGILIGFAGSDFWPRFSAQRRAEDEPDPLDNWTRRIIDELAERIGARACFPFDGPPYLPFQRWAQRAEAVGPSPLGILVHPQYGLWHGYRALLAIPEAAANPVPSVVRTDPCSACADRPCLSGCPVRAFDGTGYDVPACIAHLHAPAGSDCMSLGCAARRACPLGAGFRYAPAHAAFHMRHFRNRFG